MFGRKHMTTFGLDVGSYSVKAVQLRRQERGYFLSAAGGGRLAGYESEAGAGGGQDAGKMIRRCCREAQVKGRNAVCGVSGSEVAIREFNFPHLPVEEIGQAIYLEAAQVCPFELERSTMDYALMDEGGLFSGGWNGQGEASAATSCGVLVAAANELVEAKRRLVESAEYRCVLMDAETLALINGFLSLQSEVPSAPMALLDVGNRYTHLGIVTAGEMPFARDLAHAGAEIMGRLEVLSGGVGESAKKAKADGGDSVAGAGQEALGEACCDLISEVENTLRYYTMQQRIKGVEKIYVSGGMSLYPGFVDLLKERLPGEVTLWNPLLAMDCAGHLSGSELVREQGPAFAVATGLAMRIV